MDRGSIKRLKVSVVAVALILVSMQALAQGRGDPAQGRSIYQKYCVSCHGRQGEGLGPISGMPNFSDPSSIRNKSDRELFQKISKGGDGSGMPAWEGILNEEQRWNVLAYLRTLGR